MRHDDRCPVLSVGAGPCDCRWLVLVDDMHAVIDRQREIVEAASAYRAAEIERERAGLGSMTAASEADFQAECDALEIAETRLAAARVALDAKLRGES